MPSRRRYYRPPDTALLWARSGGLCSFPECHRVCVLEANNEDPSVIIGEIAHIEASSNDGPRPNPALSDKERDAYSNLILLCPNHHRLVDARDCTYTVKMLRGWKQDTETRYCDLLGQRIKDITFAELETVTQALVNSKEMPSDLMSIIPPLEKMNRNGLTDRVRSLFNIGIIQSDQVQEFVKTMSGIDNTFVRRLTSGFVAEYHNHRRAGLKGDSLFEAMRLFSAQGKSDIRFQAAGLAVLVYLFERCEVFEQ